MTTIPAPAPLTHTVAEARPGDVTIMVNTELHVVDRSPSGEIVLRDPKDDSTVTITPQIAEMYELRFERPVKRRDIPAAFGTIIASGEDRFLHTGPQKTGRSWLHESTGDKVATANLTEAFGDNWRVVTYGPDRWMPSTPEQVFPGDIARVEGPTGAIEGVVRGRREGFVNIDIGTVVIVSANGGTWLRLDDRERTATGPIGTV